MIIKVLLISATLVFGLLTLRGGRPATNQALRRIALLALVPVGVVAVAFPDTTVWAAHLVGVQRGTDLVLYAFVMMFLFTTLANYQRLHHLENQLIQLTRELALQESTRELAAQHETPTLR